MAHLPPIIPALMAQLLAMALIRLAEEHLALQPLPQLLLQGVVASLLGRLLRLPFWWVPINLLLPLAVAGTAALALPPWLYLLAFLLLLMLNWNSARERVPLYLSNRTTWTALDTLLPQQPGLRLIDLGSGMGGTLLYLARQRPMQRFTGVENSPLPYIIARLRLRLSGLVNVELRFGDLWREDFGAYDIVYCFLSPQPMARLYRKAHAEMRPGSLIVSNSFTVPSVPPVEIHEVADRRQTRLLCWRL